MFVKITQSQKNKLKKNKSKFGETYEFDLFFMFLNNKKYEQK